MILSTQSLDELRRSDILDVIVESCATKIFLANPDMDRELYRRQFHLNETEVDILPPHPQAAIPHQDAGTRESCNLTVDAKSYWLYTNDPYDNQRRKAALNIRLRKGLEVLAENAMNAACPALCTEVLFALAPTVLAALLRRGDAANWLLSFPSDRNRSS